MNLPEMRDFVEAFSSLQKEHTLAELSARRNDSNAIAAS